MSMEYFFDHHGLYDVSIRVPLIFYGADLPRGRVFRAFVQHVDLLPTILDVVGVEPGNLYFEGRSLVPLIKGELEDRIDALRKFVYC